MVDDAVLKGEGAHAWLLSRPSLPGDVVRLKLGLVAIVVFHRCDRGVDRDVEVVGEVAPYRRGPGKAPVHAVPVGEQLLEWRSGHRYEGDVVVLEVEMGLVEAVGYRRAAGAGCVPVGVEHEVVDEELRPTPEQVG